MALSIRLLKRVSATALRDALRKKAILEKIAALEKQRDKELAAAEKSAKAIAKLEVELETKPARRGRPAKRGPGRPAKRGPGRPAKKGKPGRKPKNPSERRGLPKLVYAALSSSSKPVPAAEILKKVQAAGWKSSTKHPLLRVYASLRALKAKKSSKGFSLK